MSATGSSGMSPFIVAAADDSGRQRAHLRCGASIAKQVTTHPRFRAQVGTPTSGGTRDCVAGRPGHQDSFEKAPLSFIQRLSRGEGRQVGGPTSEVGGLATGSKKTLSVADVFGRGAKKSNRPGLDRDSNASKVALTGVGGENPSTLKPTQSISRFWSDLETGRKGNTTKGAVLGDPLQAGGITNTSALKNKPSLRIDNKVMDGEKKTTGEHVHKAFKLGLAGWTAGAVGGVIMGGAAVTIGAVALAAAAGAVTAIVGYAGYQILDQTHKASNKKEKKKGTETNDSTKPNDTKKEKEDDTKSQEGKEKKTDPTKPQPKSDVDADADDKTPMPDDNAGGNGTGQRGSPVTSNNGGVGSLTGAREGISSCFPEREKDFSLNGNLVPYINPKREGENKGIHSVIPRKTGGKLGGGGLTQPSGVPMSGSR